MNFLRTKPAIATFIVFALMAVNTAAIYAIFEPTSELLTVSFLDVGQGDAILIESPEGVQLLIDGGRDRAVVRELPRVMSPLDRSIDMVLATHPDADHIGGLPDVLNRYRVSYYLSPGIEHGTSQAERLGAAVEDELGAVSILARKGMRIHLGESVYADVLYPDRDVSKAETNSGSVVVRLVYGNTSFMFTGDAPSSVEDYLIALGGELDSDVLKAGHHGSHTSTSAAWLDAVTPSVVVISAGKDNSYGHPHEEVLERVRASGASVASTVEDGTIIFKSDGRTMVHK
ncbi:MAG: ComEC/Rec2 family competence protein [Patescibacteria group bacterium]